MFSRTTKIYMTALDVLPVKMTTRHIIYMEKAYDEDLNFFIQSHYTEIRNHFKERNYEFCYFPRMTESELTDFVKEEYLPKGILPLSSMALKSTLMYDCQTTIDKEESLIPSPSLLFCTRDPKGEPSPVAIYRRLSLDMNSQWYLKNDFSNLLDDICFYLAGDPDMAYDSEEEAERLYMDPEFLASLPEPDFDNYEYDDVERELDLDFEEGSLRHEISKLREETEDKVRQINLMGHDSIFKYSLVRSCNEEAVFPNLFPNLYVRKDFSFLIRDVEEDIVIDLKDAMHKTVYLLFLRHPEGIRHGEFAQYREEIVKIYGKFRPTYIDYNGEFDPLKNLIEYAQPLVERVSRINGNIKQTIGDEKIAAGYIIQNVGDGLRRITIANTNGVIWQQKS